MAFGVLPRGEPPKWAKAWRCPPCGTPAVRFSFDGHKWLDGSDVRGITEFECERGHVRQIAGLYSDRLD